ncbi:MAG: HAD-IIB family hydrolase [Gammaproteobacteria bacterium]|nr:HAD-IIB family hydrolase [Gammaproteobacteria bacterium]
MTEGDRKLYIVLISVHGLIRGHNLELGRDADTGGQTKYVLELMRTLARHPAVGRVDLLTRQIHDPKVGSDYAVPLEQIAPNAFIVRLACGPRRYLRKEVLWPHLDTFADQALKHIRRVRRVPDVIHAHYADAGYVGAQLAGLLEAPLAFTGHSLGHVKRERMLERGLRPETIEGQYHIGQRIEAENIALDNAAFVVASTQQEVEVQYSRYDNYRPERMVVIPPGIDLERFHPPVPGASAPPIRHQIERFLSDASRPMILALARPDPRKNLSGLVRAYAETPGLREYANLVLIAGTRDDVLAMEKGPRRVLSEIMFLIDHYDLYGHVAYPKQHRPEDVPELYRWAAKSRGVFVNPALTEPFGLTLLEAAASGLPIVATRDGGPRDIVKYCRNGLLVDPLDTAQLGEALFEALRNRRRWRRWSQAGVAGAKRHFTWEGHVMTYIKEISQVLDSQRAKRRAGPSLKSRLPVCDRILVCDIDNTLIGDRAALRELLSQIDAAPGRIGFGIATGRRLDSAVKVLREWGVPGPDFFITAAGSEIHYGPKRVEDDGWFRHIDYLWEPERVREILRGIPGLRMQPKEEQRQYKISYYLDPGLAPGMRDLTRHLRRHDVHVNVIYSHQAFLDLLPVRASKGAAVRYFADKWDIPFNHILAAGDSGNDEEMLSGTTLGVVVGNHSAELDRLRGHDRVYFANGYNAWGIIEGIEYYDFLGRLRESHPRALAESTANE